MTHEEIRAVLANPEAWRGMFSLVERLCFLVTTKVSGPEGLALAAQFNEVRLSLVDERARNLAQALAVEAHEATEREAAVRRLLRAASALWREPLPDDRAGDPRWPALLDAIDAVRGLFPEGT